MKTTRILFLALALLFIASSARPGQVVHRRNLPNASAQPKVS